MAGRLPTSNSHASSAAAAPEERIAITSNMGIDDSRNTRNQDDSEMGEEEDFSTIDLTTTHGVGGSAATAASNRRPAAAAAFLRSAGAAARNRLQLGAPAAAAAGAGRRTLYSRVDGDAPEESTATTTPTTGNQENDHQGNEITRSDNPSAANEGKPRVGAAVTKESAAASSEKSIDEEDADDEEDEEEEDDFVDDGRRVKIVILDFCQKKFPLSLHPQQRVATLKRVGAAVHKVAPDRQRLIFRGKMLSDDAITLTEALTEAVCNSTEEVIVHLFPKPRVVIKQQPQTQTLSGKDSAVSTNDSSTTNANDNNDANQGSGGDDNNNNDPGASVPTIVLDPTEAAGRSQILVLGSADYMEAQNNVKLFSFMLLIISSIELLNLLAIAFGVPQNTDVSLDSTSGGANGDGGLPEDFPTLLLHDDDLVNTTTQPGPGEFVDPSYNNMGMMGGGGGIGDANTDDYNNSINAIYQTWTPDKYVDLAVSLAGVYVALLGIRATNENTLVLARRYLYGTCLVGIGWLLYNYFMTYTVDQAIEGEERRRHSLHNTTNSVVDPSDLLPPDLTNKQLAYQALSVMMLPGMVWFLCCLRAWQFEQLLAEAENEAQTRIQNELQSMNALQQQELGQGGSTQSTTSDAQPHPAADNVLSSIREERRERRRRRRRVIAAAAASSSLSSLSEPQAVVVTVQQGAAAAARRSHDDYDEELGLSNNNNENGRPSGTMA